MRAGGWRRWPWGFGKVQAVLYKRKETSQFPAPVCNRTRIPQSQDIPLVTSWKEGFSFFHASTGSEDRCQAAIAQGLDKPQMGPLRSSMEFPRGDRQQTSLSLPLGPLLICILCSQSTIHMKMPTVYSPFPHWKRTFLFLRCFWILWCYCLRTVSMKKKESGCYGRRWRYI